MDNRQRNCIGPAYSASRQIRRGNGGGGFNSHIFEKIISLENLFLAWREFKRGKGKKFDVQQFGFNLEDNLFQLHYELKTKSYQPLPYQSFYVSDPKLRHIHKAAIRDRVVHQAIYRRLYPLFDRQFIFDSYSCRLVKGTHKAVKRLEDFCRCASRNYTRPAYGLKCDIKKFFDNIDHDILRVLLRTRVADVEALWLVDKVIASFTAKPGKGLPLGNVTSQLFANIYLNELDQFIKHGLKIKHYLRYTDDFIIVSQDKNYLADLIEPLEEFLNNKLAIQLHPQKIIIRKLGQGLDWLGYVILPHYRVLRTKTKRRIFKKTKQKQRLLAAGEINETSFNQTLQSYYGILKHCRGHKIRKEVENIVETN